MDFGCVYLELLTQALENRMGTECSRLLQPLCTLKVSVIPLCRAEAYFQQTAASRELQRSLYCSCCGAQGPKECVGRYSCSLASQQPKTVSPRTNSSLGCFCIFSFSFFSPFSLPS